MTVLNTIRAAIRERRQMLIRFNDNGVARTGATEPYLLGFDRSDANAFDQFKAILSSIYLPSGAWPAYWGLN